MFPGHGGGRGVLPPGVQGEVEGGADGEGEGEGLPLAGQRLAELQALDGQGVVTSHSYWRCHFCWIYLNQTNIWGSSTERQNMIPGLNRMGD